VNEKAKEIIWEFQETADKGKEKYRGDIEWQTNRFINYKMQIWYIT
jgi:hypothetical protein